MKGKKFDQGKPKLHLLVKEALDGAAYAFMMGEEKYGKWNYREGIEYTKICDSLMRHTLAFLNGEDLDPESGLPHTFHINANAHIIEYMRVHKPEMDDRHAKKEDVSDKVKKG